VARRRPSLAALSLVALAALGLALVGKMATGTAHASGGSLSGSACNLLAHAGARQLVGEDAGHPALVSPQGFGCFVSVCSQTYVDPDTGAQKCQLGRGATLSLSHPSTPDKALKYVRRALRQGYKRVNVKGADLAGIVDSAKGAGLIMSVGRSLALFALGAYSDNDPNPQWGPGARNQLLHSAHRVAKDLNLPGCPVRRCPGGS
jgi:hypothetical protein